MSICLALTDVQWALTKDVFSVLGAVATIVGVAFAGYVGLSGLSTWKRQLSGTSNHKLAKQILVALYKYRDAVYYVRNPWISPAEMDWEDLRLREVPEKERGYFGKCAAYEKRFLLVAEASRELDVLLFEAEALWEDELIKLVRPLHEMSQKLYVYIETHLMSIDPMQDYDYRREYGDIIKSQPNIMRRAAKGEKDDFAFEFKKCVKSVEDYLRPKL